MLKFGVPRFIMALSYSTLMNRVVLLRDDVDALVVRRLRDGRRPALLPELGHELLELIGVDVLHPSPDVGPGHRFAHSLVDKSVDRT